MTKCNSTGKQNNPGFREEYLDYGFIKSRIDEGKPESILCAKIVAADSMKSVKLKRHQKANHRSSLDSDIEYFRVVVSINFNL